MLQSVPEPEYYEIRAEIVEAGSQVTVRTVDGLSEPLYLSFPHGMIPSVYDEITLRGRGAAVRGTGRLTDGSRDLGAQFFTALFKTSLGRSFHETVARAERQGSGTRLRIVTMGDHAQQLPWELLFDPIKNGFLALARGMAIVRTVAGTEMSAPARSRLPLRITAVTADVTGDLETSLDTAMLRQLAERSRGRVDLTVVENATAEDVRRALQHPCDLFYFAGTGSESLQGRRPPDGQGLAVFGADRVIGVWNTLESRQLAEWMKKTEVRAAVFASCHTDLIARELAGSGIAATVGFRGLVKVHEMMQLCTGLCRSLLAGDPFELALCEARHAVDLFSPGSRQWALAHAYLQAPTGHLFPALEDAPALTVSLPEAPTATRSAPHVRELASLIKRKELDEQRLAAVDRRIQDHLTAGLAVPELQQEHAAIQRRIEEIAKKVAALSASAS